MMTMMLVFTLLVSRLFVNTRTRLLRVDLLVLCRCISIRLVYRPFVDCCDTALLRWLLRRNARGSGGRWNTR
jgi:hypothetical protein